jgi:hypothetical protein
VDLLTQQDAGDGNTLAGVLAIGILIGIAITYKTVKTVILARLAWSDYKATKAKVPILKKIAILLWRTAIGRIVLSGALIAIVLMIAVGPSAFGR